MAVMRFRNRVLILMLVVSFLSMIYLLSLLPQKDEMMSFPGQNRFLLRKIPKESVSVTRKHSTTASHENHRLLPVMNVLAPPHFFLTDLHKADLGHKNVSVIDNGNGSKSLENRKTENYRKENKNLSAKTIGTLIKNKTYELGFKRQNKTVAVGEKIKNKTLEHLGLLGVEASKRLPQLMFVQRKWNLTVSFDDIGDIMKETQFLNKVDPLNLSGPILLSSHNRTVNFTYNMPIKLGYCDCFERYCVCCSKITNKRLHLNTTACSNFTFVSKTHELDLEFSMDGKLVHTALVSADKSPMMCMGSVPKVADICVHFFNMTFRVNEHNAAQTQLLGCTDLSLNLYNRTIGAFPVDCFQIPGDPNKVHKERNFNLIFNWVP